MGRDSVTRRASTKPVFGAKIVHGVQPDLRYGSFERIETFGTLENDPEHARRVQNVTEGSRILKKTLQGAKIMEFSRR